MAASAVVMLTACLPELAVTYDSTSTSKQVSAVLSKDGTDTYQLTSTAGAMDAAAIPGNTGGNLRTLFWPDKAPAVADSQGCAVWSSQTGDIVQQGAAIRIRKDSSRVRAITVTKNIYFHAFWIFNFHTWDTARKGDPFVQFGSASISALVANSQLLPLPWNFCVRAVGSVIEFKVWPSSVTEPAWGDPTWGGQATIPDGWGTAGRTGWYIGHLGPTEQARFDNLRTWKYNGTPAPIPTTSTTTSSSTSTSTSSTSTSSTSTSSTSTSTSTSTTNPTTTSSTEPFTLANRPGSVVVAG